MSNRFLLSAAVVAALASLVPRAAFGQHGLVGAPLGGFHAGHSPALSPSMAVGGFRAAPLSVMAPRAGAGHGHAGATPAFRNWTQFSQGGMAVRSGGVPTTIDLARFAAQPGNTLRPSPVIVNGLGAFNRPGTFPLLIPRVNPQMYFWPFGVYGVGWGGPLWWAIGYPGWGVYPYCGPKIPVLLIYLAEASKAVEQFARALPSPAEQVITPPPVAAPPTSIPPETLRAMGLGSARPISDAEGDTIHGFGWIGPLVNGRAK